MLLAKLYETLKVGYQHFQLDYIHFVRPFIIFF